MESEFSIRPLFNDNATRRAYIPVMAKMLTATITTTTSDIRGRSAAT